MKKLNLNLEQLAVESFETADAERRVGTVRAYVCSDVCTASCPPGTCGILPISAESECNAFPQSKWCGTGDTCDFSDCGPCCV
ncbi:MAG TPA: hypothetical protein VFJ82_09700 [Longimicrobium sp.]|nr:hypothetical protein [Longimicrobium sp.]